MDISITQIQDLPSHSIAPLIADSEGDGWVFVRRLADEWESGANRFHQPGEKLFVARVDGTIIGVCGLNVDPYISDNAVGRVRRLYILRTHRQLGAGRMLVEAVIGAALGRFETLRLRTNNPTAGRLYERLGFLTVQDDTDCTHLIKLNQISGVEKSI